MSNNIISQYREYRLEKVAAPLARTAKVLCTNHNAMLSPLDVVGGRLHRALLKKAPFELPLEISGIDVERFLFQRLCAFYFGKMFTADGLALPQQLLSLEVINRVLIDCALPPGAGLYLAAPPEHFDWREPFEITPMLNRERSRILGVRLSIAFVAFVLLFEPTLLLDAVSGLRPARLLAGRAQGSPLDVDIRFHWTDAGEHGVVEWIKSRGTPN